LFSTTIPQKYGSSKLKGHSTATKYDSSNLKCHSSIMEEREGKGKRAGQRLFYP